MVGCPVRQGDAQLFDAQRSLGVRQRAERVRRADESVGAGGRGRGQQTADPLSEHDPPRGFGELDAKKGHPVCEPISGTERLCPVSCRHGRTGGRHRIELPPVSVCPGNDGVAASQRDQRLGGHRSVVGRDAARDFGPGSSEPLECSSKVLFMIDSLRLVRELHGIGPSGDCGLMDACRATSCAMSRPPPPSMGCRSDTSYYPR